MKGSLYFFFIRKILVLVSFLVCNLSIGQSMTSEEELARSMIKALQSRDFNNYRKLLLTENDFVSEILPAIRRDTIHHIPEWMLNDSKDFYRSGKPEMLNRHLFSEILRTSDSLGITDWEKVQFVRFGVVGQKAVNDTIPGIISGDIFLSFNSQKFAIYGTIITKLKTGMRLTLTMGIVKAD